MRQYGDVEDWKRYSGHVVFTILGLVTLILFVRIGYALFVNGLWQAIKIWKTNIFFGVSLSMTLKVWRNCWKKWVPNDPKRHVGIMTIHGGRITNELLPEGKSFLPAIPYIDAGAITMDATKRTVKFTTDMIPTEVENPLKPGEMLRGHLKMKFSLIFSVDDSNGVYGDAIDRIKQFIDIGQVEGLAAIARGKIQSLVDQICAGKKLNEVDKDRKAISNQIFALLLDIDLIDLNEAMKAVGVKDIHRWGIIIYDLIIEDVDGSGPLEGILSAKARKAAASQTQTNFAADGGQGTTAGFTQTGADAEEAYADSGHGWTPDELDEFGVDDDEEDQASQYKGERNLFCSPCCFL